MGRAPECVLQTITTTQNNALRLKSSQQSHLSLAKWHHFQIQFSSEAQKGNTLLSFSLIPGSQSMLQVASSAAIFFPVYLTALLFCNEAVQD